MPKGDTQEKSAAIQAQMDKLDKMRSNKAFFAHSIKRVESELDQNDTRFGHEETLKCLVNYANKHELLMNVKK